MQSPDFWKDHKKASKISKELNDIKEELNYWDSIEAKTNDLIILDEEELLKREEEVVALDKKFRLGEIKTFLSGKYDKNNALIYIYSGAGGVDAQDWASMLLRMYKRYGEKNNFETKMIDHSLGEQGGTKNAVMEMAGKYAYGLFKNEAGVHRLVRVSPFSAKSLRHTSFALVEVLPEIESADGVEIKSDDLTIDTYKSSGPGGQNVNKLETAVRVTHLPTGLSATVQSERSQSQNKEKAMKILTSRLVKLMEEQKIEELSKLKAEIGPGGIEWGSQIRSYVLHPYKLVKDHRTGLESHNPDKVLEGDIDEFLNSSPVVKDF